VVFMAEQTVPVRRKVALKVLKPGMDTRQVVARFEAERQALALLDHPNIARVFDGGSTPAGRPYFVMELVRGVPITEFCDQNQLTPRQRLELFIPVCQAVQHAHQKGIIHRDLKPSNVLVSRHDTTPVAKVIDFGVAKALGQELTDKTLFTGIAQLIGTPMYMSPEQAGMSDLDVDTRSDIYSLGVLLYELLTGTTPFDKKRFQDAGYDEIVRIIRDEEPPRPSTRLAESTVTRPTVAAQRHTEPARLTKLVRGELDWIVMKCLEKDRGRRYETANSLALDVQRYLADEPVQACPPSAGYRLRKFARRNKWSLVTWSLLGALLLLLVVGIPVTAILRHERDRAIDNQRRAERAEALATAAENEVRLRAHVARAAALRRGRQAGQRFQCLREVAEALKLDPSPEMRAELRTEAIACLALPDLDLSGPRHPWPDHGYWFDFDEAQALYARTDREGNCSVRRVADDVEIHRLPGRGIPYLSRDGKFLAVVGLDVERQDVAGAQVWHLDGGTPRRILSETHGRHVDFHPKGQQVALVYTDGSIGWFELPSGKNLNRLPPDTLTREVVCALHPTEPVVAVTTYFGSVVQLRDVRTAKVLKTLQQGTRPYSVAWNSDGRTLAVGLAEARLIRLYDYPELRVFQTLEISDVAYGLALNHAGDRLISAGWGSHLELFDVGTGQRLFTSRSFQHTRRFSSDDRRLAGAIQDGKLGIWQVADGREYRTLFRKALPEKQGYESLSMSPDGRLIAAAMWDGFGIWDLASGNEVAFIPTGGRGNRVHFEPSGDLLALGSTGLFRWPIVRESGAAGNCVVGPPRRLPLPRGSCLDQSGDGRVIVTCSRAVSAEQVHAGGWILHADRPGQPIRIDAGADIGFITVSPDGRFVVTVPHGTGGSATVWDASNGKFVKRLAERGAGYPRFSLDSRWLSTDLDGGRLVAVDTWEPGPRMGGTGAFTKDGNLLAVPTSTAAIRLVDPATGRELAVLEDPNQDQSFAPVFTPDRTRLIVMSAVRGAHIWDLRLIRRHLAGMGLDWDAPPYPPADPGSKVVPLKVEVRLGDPVQATQSREQRARQAIQSYRRAVKNNADDPMACNNLAWVYLTAPEELRDVKAAVPLAEKAVRLDPGNGVYGNTLGVAYYRDGRYREAADILRANLARQEDWGLAFDLYFLAMSHHKLGETARARDYYDWAGRWPRTDQHLAPGHLEELDMFRAEASELLGVNVGIEIAPPPREIKK
ncbi:MAG TPA: protein kinase, partial [Gemmataceae bacterium]|nr:protein kinase [Gemmataceae bacterium]